MQLPVKQALGCWLASMILIIVALLAFIGLPPSADGAAQSIGRSIAHTGLAAIFSWLLARRKSPHWSWGKFILVYVVTLVVLGLITNSGRSHSVDQAPFPFSVSYSAGWKVERLEGVSSAPPDHKLGVREQAQWFEPNGRAVVSLTCAWLKEGDRPVLAEELARIVQGVTKGLEAQKLEVQSTSPSATVVAAHPGLMMELHATSKQHLVLTQLVAVTTSDRCFFSAVLATSSDAKPAQRQEFDRIRKEIVFR